MRGHTEQTYCEPFLEREKSLPFRNPSTQFATHCWLWSRSKPNAVVLDFFAGSGTTLHATTLINAADNGRRQCILVTNNEVSEEDRKRLLRANHGEGDSVWDAHGICEAVTWPRCKFVVHGKRDDGTTLAGQYATGNYEEQEIKRSIVHLGFVEGATLPLAGRKDVARLIDGATLGLVSATDPWHLEEEGKASILWDISKGDDWLDALIDEPQVERLYVATIKKATFKKVADGIKEILPPLLIEREITRTMAAGFDENIAYFALGFLDPGDVARGQQFAAILPLLWMMTGSKAKCPEPGRIRKWLIAQECGFAVLHNEELFLDFCDELKGIKNIDHVFLVTDSEDTFKEMRVGLRKGLRTYMLYSSYLRNFGINVRSVS